jgi:hypothetical protein
MLFGVANFDRQSIINNTVGVFDVPVVLTTVETTSFQRQAALRRLSAVGLRPDPRADRRRAYMNRRRFATSARRPLPTVAALYVDALHASRDYVTYARGSAAVSGQFPH